MTTITATEIHCLVWLYMEIVLSQEIVQEDLETEGRE